jgi:hypothetical protein
MAEYLLFFGESYTGSAGSPTIWMSDGTTDGTQTIATAAGLTPAEEQAQALVAGGYGGIGNPPRVAGPLLFYAYDKIYTQAASLLGAQQDNNDQLLVWDTHGKSDPGAWTNGVINPYNGNSFQPQAFAAYDGLVYFNGQSPDISYELYWTNGTSVTQITGWGLDPSSLTLAFGQLFFAGNNGLGDNVLYAYNGSGEPYQVADVYNPAYLTASPVGTYTWPFLPFDEPDNQLFMSGQEQPGGPTWLYRYDGTNLHQIAPASAPATGLQPYDLCGFNWQTDRKLGELDGEPIVERFFNFAVGFSGIHNNGRRGLWISGGTSETTTQIDYGLPSGLDLNPFNLTAFNLQLYFTGQDKNTNKTSPNYKSAGYGLYAYDPLTGDIREVTNSGTADLTFNSAFGGSNQPTMTAFNNDLYFSALSNLTTASSPETVPNLWRANLDSQGNASPSAVKVTQNALTPCSLTTTDDL